MRRITALILGFVLLPAALYAIDFEVEYVYGNVEIRTASGWQPADFGSVVAEDSLLRLDIGAVAELSAGALRITLSEPGTYSLAELAQASHQISSWGILQVVRGKIHSLFREQPRTESAAMGTRAVKPEEEGMGWADEEEDAVKEGTALYEEQKYLESIAYFEEALELADEPNKSLYLFYVGCAYAMAGESGQAMRYLSQSDPSQIGPHRGDYVLLKGQLLLEGGAYEAALSLVDPFLERNPRHELSQSLYYLSAHCNERLGKREQARTMLRKAYAIDPDSDTGRKAGLQLDSL